MGKPRGSKAGGGIEVERLRVKVKGRAGWSKTLNKRGLRKAEKNRKYKDLCQMCKSCSLGTESIGVVQRQCRSKVGGDPQRQVEESNSRHGTIHRTYTKGKE